MTIIPVTGIPEVVCGDDVAGLLWEALRRNGSALQPADVVVVTHKIISKAEGAVADAIDEAAYRAIVSDESVEILRRRGDLVIAKTRHGFICANAGVDRSNVPAGRVVLLPRDPDASAHGIRTRLQALSGTDIGVVISDTFGRPWRRGLVDVAVGISGVTAILDMRGTSDASGRELQVTEIAVADEIAAAADLVMGKSTAIPAAIVRGIDVAGNGRATDYVRPAAEDMFR